jgi:hypothetical protein
MQNNTNVSPRPAQNNAMCIALLRVVIQTLLPLEPFLLRKITSEHQTKTKTSADIQTTQNRMISSTQKTKKAWNFA